MMMNNNPFNSVFENSLRLVILLDSFVEPQTLDMLYVIDFMTINGSLFGFSNSNLNGNRIYKFSEFASRRELIKKAIKELVLNGFVRPINSKSGVVYSITQNGKDYCKKLDSVYALEYKSIVTQVIENTKGKSAQELIRNVNHVSVKNK